MTRAALLLLLLLVPFLLPSDAPAPPLGGNIDGLYQINGGICTDGQFLVNNNSLEWVCGDPAATTTSGAIIDIADDGTNESLGLAEIATTGDTAAIFTESAPDKFLINVGLPWPAASALAANGANCSAGEAAGGVDTAGASEDCVDPITEAELNTEADLEAQLGDVIDIFTNNDGDLTDDNLSDDDIAALQNVNADADAADNEILLGDGTAYRGVDWPVCNSTTQKIHFDGSVLSCQTDGGESGGGSSIVLDLGDNGSHESEGILEIATDESPSAIFTEPTANKLKINTAQPWPTASALASNPANCSAGDVAGGVDAAGTAEDCVTPLTLSDDISTLADVNADANAADEQILLGDGSEFRGVTWPSCNSTTEKVHLDPDTNALTCAADAGGSASTLDAGFDAGDGEIDSALCGTKTFKVSVGGDDFIEICVDAGGTPRVIATCDGAGCDNIQGIAEDRNFILHDSETANDMWTVDPDAATPNAMYQIHDGYQLLGSVEWPAAAMFGDGTECDTDPTTESISGVPTQGMRCPMTTSETDGFIYGLPITIPGDFDKTADITFSAKAYLITDGGAGTWHGQIAIDCVGEGETPNAFGTQVGLDLTPAVGDVVNDEIHDAAAIAVDTDTTGSDCDPGDTLYWQYRSCDTDATPSTGCTSSAGFENDMSIFSVSMQYKKNSLSE